MDTEQRKVMEEYGYKKGFTEIEGLQKQPKMTYYKPDGEPLPNLPADPMFMRRYLNRGLTLTPPAPPPSAKEKAEVSEFACSVCGKVLKNKIGLMGHSRSHKS